MFTIMTVVMVPWVHIYVKTFKMYTLSMCSLLCANYISIKQFFKNKKSKCYACTLISTLRIYHKESEMCAKM